MRGTFRAALAGTVAAVLALSGCTKRAPFEPPPRATDTIPSQPQASAIAVPVSASLDELQRALERQVPRTLWSIDRKDMTCIASSKVKVLVVKIKTPTIKCDIAGEVTRGALSLSGSGEDIVVTMPIRAVVRASDIAGVIKGETATASAQVRAIAHLSLTRDWQPRGTMTIRYDWRDAPHVDILGQRIEFASKADDKLKGVIANLERTLPRELEKLDLRTDIASAWRQAFTSVPLNRSNPPVWMRITPQGLQYGGYAIEGRRLLLRLGMTAQTETFVGNRPPDPTPAPLPPLAQLKARTGKLQFFIPVIADYAELEPVIARALAKRAAQPFTIPGIGNVEATFGKITVYATTGHRIAVGGAVTVRDVSGRFGRASGTIWLTGLPINQENARKVDFTDVRVSGDTDRVGTNLLLGLANSPDISHIIAEALGQNFEHDYAKLLGKIDRAIDQKREGQLMIRARIENVETGRLVAAGQGLYLLVRGTGTASVGVTPR